MVYWTLNEGWVFWVNCKVIIGWLKEFPSLSRLPPTSQVSPWCRRPISSLGRRRWLGENLFAGLGCAAFRFFFVLFFGFGLGGFCRLLVRGRRFMYLCFRVWGRGGCFCFLGVSSGLEKEGSVLSFCLAGNRHQGVIKAASGSSNKTVAEAIETSKDPQCKNHQRDHKQQLQEAQLTSGHHVSSLKLLLKRRSTSKRHFQMANLDDRGSFACETLLAALDIVWDPCGALGAEGEFTQKSTKVFWLWRFLKDFEGWRFLFFFHWFFSGKIQRLECGLGFPSDKTSSRQTFERCKHRSFSSGAASNEKHKTHPRNHSLTSLPKLSSFLFNPPRTNFRREATLLLNSPTGAFWKLFKHHQRKHRQLEGLGVELFCFFDHKKATVGGVGVVFFWQLLFEKKHKKQKTKNQKKTKKPSLFLAQVMTAGFASIAGGVMAVAWKFLLVLMGPFVGPPWVFSRVSVIFLWGGGDVLCFSLLLSLKWAGLWVTLFLDIFSIFLPRVAPFLPFAEKVGGLAQSRPGPPRRTPAVRRWNAEAREVAPAEAAEWAEGGGPRWVLCLWCFCPKKEEKHRKKPRFLGTENLFSF